MDPRPKVKAKTMKQLKEDIKKKLHDMNFSNFLDMTPETQTTKEKNSVLHQNKKICVSRDAINRVKKQTTEREF